MSMSALVEAWGIRNQAQGLWVNLKLFAVARVLPLALIEKQGRGGSWLRLANYCQVSPLGLAPRESHTLEMMLSCMPRSLLTTQSVSPWLDSTEQP